MYICIYIFTNRYIDIFVSICICIYVYIYICIYIYIYIVNCDDCFGGIASKTHTLVCFSDPFNIGFWMNCNILQHNTVNCNTLHHTAKHRLWGGFD